MKVHLITGFLICLPIQMIAQSTTPETHKVLVRVVLIDVVVIDKNGDFVSDLKKEDFEVYEDGRSRPINSVQLISQDIKEKAQRTEETYQAESRGKIYAIFDCLNTDHITLRRAKTKILSLLSNLIKEGFEIKIIILDKEKGIKVINESLETDNLEELISNIEGSKEVLLWEGGEEREEVSHWMEKLFWRERLQKTIWYLLQVVGMIRNESGRKSVLLISEGLPEKQSQIFRDPGWSTRIRVFDPFNIIQKDDYIDIINELIKYANTHRISFYWIDPRIAEYIENNFAFQNLSERTGGGCFRGGKRFERCEDTIRNSFTYYEIAYTPFNAEEDGKFHKIEVRVKRKGLKVFLREGYVDYKKEDLERINLASAFLAPSFYRDIKFDCSFIALPQRNNYFKVWGRLNIPLEQFRRRELASEKVKFLFGIKEITRERVHYGETVIDIGEELKKANPYFHFYIGTSGLKIKPGNYEISAVVTDLSGRTGAWEGWLKLLDLKREKEIKVINFVPGILIQNSEKGKPFTFSERDALLNLGKFKFVPYFEDSIKREETIAIFVQMFVPGNKKFEEPVFYFEHRNQEVKVGSKLIEKQYDEKTKCFSLVYTLSLKEINSGEYTLSLVLPTYELKAGSVKLEII